MSEWISVKDRLPRNGMTCLVVWQGLTQHMLYTRDDGTGEWLPVEDEAESAPEGTFSHWQPLPDPPEAA